MATPGAEGDFHQNKPVLAKEKQKNDKLFEAGYLGSAQAAAPGEAKNSGGQSVNTSKLEPNTKKTAEPPTTAPKEPGGPKTLPSATDMKTGPLIPEQATTVSSAQSKADKPVVQNRNQETAGGLAPSQPGTAKLIFQQGDIRQTADSDKVLDRAQESPVAGATDARPRSEAHGEAVRNPAQQATAPKEIVFPAADQPNSSVAGIAKESSSQMAYTKDSPASAPPPAKPVGEEVAKRSVAFRGFISNDSILSQQPKTKQISSTDPVPAGDGQRESKKKLAEGEMHEAHAQAQHEAAPAHASAPAAAPEQRESNKQNGEHAPIANTATKSENVFQQSAKEAKPNVLDTQGRSDAGTMRSTEQPVKEPRRIDIAGDGAQAPRVPFRFSDDHKEPSSDAPRWTQYGTKTVPVPGEHIDPPTFRGTANIRSDGNPFIVPHEGGTWGGTAGGARGGERVVGGKSDGLVGATGGRTTTGEILTGKHDGASGAPHVLPWILTGRGRAPQQNDTSNESRPTRIAEVLREPLVRHDATQLIALLKDDKSPFEPGTEAAHNAERLSRMLGQDGLEKLFGLLSNRNHPTPRLNIFFPPFEQNCFTRPLAAV